MRLIKTITTISIIYINVFVYMKQSEVLATQSRLFDTPMDLPDSSVHGIHQAKIPFPSPC